MLQKPGDALVLQKSGQRLHAIVDSAQRGTLGLVAVPVGEHIAAVNIFEIDFRCDLLKTGKSLRQVFTVFTSC